MTMVDFREALKARYVLTKIIEFINKSEIELSKLVYREEE